MSKPPSPPPRRRRTSSVYIDAKNLEIVEASVIWTEAISLLEMTASLAAAEAVKLRDPIAKARKLGGAELLRQAIGGLRIRANGERRLITWDEGDKTPTVSMRVPPQARR